MKQVLILSGLLIFVAITEVMAAIARLLEPVSRASYDEYAELWSDPRWGEDDPGRDVDEEGAS